MLFASGGMYQSCMQVSEGFASSFAKKRIRRLSPTTTRRGGGRTGRCMLTQAFLDRALRESPLATQAPSNGYNESKCANRLIDSMISD